MRCGGMVVSGVVLVWHELGGRTLKGAREEGRASSEVNECSGGGNSTGKVERTSKVEEKDPTAQLNVQEELELVVMVMRRREKQKRTCALSNPRRRREVRSGGHGTTEGNMVGIGYETARSAGWSLVTVPTR